MRPVRVALLGATSHIAKGLIAYWIKDNNRDLLLYARSPERVQEFMTRLEPCRAEVFSIEEFGSKQYDVIVNCVGIGNPQKLRETLKYIFSITTRFDDLILDYLASHPKTLYVNLSSGAAYGTDFSQPVDEQSLSCLNINALKPEEYYGIAKLHSEARHRSMPELSIVDLRIFGYFSRYIHLDEKFLLSEIISCLKSKQTLVTSPINIWRDYLHPLDLVSLIECIITNQPVNAVYDAYSNKHVSKFELLDFFAKTYGLKYLIDESCQVPAVTGQKSRYYSNGRTAREIGYIPKFTSIAGIKAEADAIIQTQFDTDFQAN